VRADGEVVGVLGDRDLFAAETRTPFTLRREIDAAQTIAQIQALARRLPQVLVALHDSDTSALQISGVHSAIADAIITRLLALAAAAAGRPDVQPVWIALGSHGRRELAPGSDLDSAVTWTDEVDAAEEPTLRRVAGEAIAAVAGVAGVAPDAHGATADSSLFARSLDSWREVVRRWAADPTVEKVPIVLSAVLDGRVLGPGPAWSEAVHAEMTHPSVRVELQRWLLRLALAHRVPTGLARSRVLGPVGARGHVDLKRDGLLPIVDLARYAGFVAGAGVLSTPERLRAAADQGVLAAADARMLVEAHELFSDLRTSHHVELLRAEQPIGDAVDPAALNALTRRYVRDAFSLVAGVQRRIAADLPLA
jgi:CBS domain-containing protein